MAKAKPVKKLKDAMQALQKSLSFSRGRSGAQPDECMSEDEIVVVPEDVKEGHFAVLAVHGERPPKRYVVSHWFSCGCLRWPAKSSDSARLELLLCLVGLVNLRE